MAGSKHKVKILAAVVVVVFGGVYVLQTSTANQHAAESFENETWMVENYSWHELDGADNSYIQDTEVDRVHNASNSSEVYAEDVDYEVAGENASIRALSNGSIDAGNTTAEVSYTVEHWRRQQAAFIGLTQTLIDVVALVVLVTAVAALYATVVDFRRSGKGGLGR